MKEQTPEEKPKSLKLMDALADIAPEMESENAYPVAYGYFIKGYNACSASKDKEIEELKAENEKLKNEREFLICSNIQPKDREGISTTLLLFWAEIENWYGDIKRKETGEQFLKRCQKTYFKESDLQSQIQSKEEEIEKLIIKEAELMSLRQTLKESFISGFVPCREDVSFHDAVILAIGKLREELESKEEMLGKAVGLLEESKLQLEYMQNKFKETGSGNNVINQLDTFLSHFNQENNNQNPGK